MWVVSLLILYLGCGISISVSPWEPSLSSLLWHFYINPPPGGAITFILVGFFNQDTAIDPRSSLSLKENIKKTNLLGTAVLVPSTTFLLIALQRGGSTYGCSNARIIILFAFSGLLLGGFVWLQWQAGDDALLPPRIMRQRIS